MATALCPVAVTVFGPTRRRLPQRKIPAILDYVGDRTFAWLDDQVTYHDAIALLADHDCLILRAAPRRGIEGASPRPA